jgi:hypothetical protein
MSVSLPHDAYFVSTPMRETEGDLATATVATSDTVDRDPSYAGRLPLPLFRHPRHARFERCGGR